MGNDGTEAGSLPPGKRGLRIDSRVPRGRDWTHREQGRPLYRFVLIELEVAIDTDAAHEEAAESLARLAKERCIVAGALDVPIRLRLKVHTEDHELAIA